MVWLGKGFGLVWLGMVERGKTVEQKVCYRSKRKHTIGIRQKGRQRSSLLVEGLRTSHLAARMIWRKVFGMNQNDHPFFQSIHSAKYPLFCSSFSSNHPGAKWLVQHGIESIFSQSSSNMTFAFPSVWFLNYGEGFGARMRANTVVHDERGMVWYEQYGLVWFGGGISFPVLATTRICHWLSLTASG